MGTNNPIPKYWPLGVRVTRYFNINVLEHLTFEAQLKEDNGKKEYKPKSGQFSSLESLIPGTSFPPLSTHQQSLEDFPHWISDHLPSGLQIGINFFE